MKYRFVTTLCKLLASKCDISPARDKHICSLGFIAYSCLDFINGNPIGSSGGISPLWEQIFGKHLSSGPGTVQIALTHPQYLQTTPHSLAPQFVDMFLLFFTSLLAFLGGYDVLVCK